MQRVRKQTSRVSLAGQSDGSSCSLSSVTSRLSVDGADQQTIAQHDAKLQEKFNKGDIEFLVNLLGAADAACGFLRKRKLEYYEEFVTGSGRAPKVDRREIEDVVKTNWPEELAVSLGVHDTLVLRMALKPHFEKPINKQHAKDLLAICKDHGTHTTVGSEVDPALVQLWAECCRRQNDDYCFFLARTYTTSHTQLEIMTSQSLTSQSIYVSPDEKKKIIRYSKQFFERYQDQLMKCWMYGIDDDDDGGCCVIL